MKYLFFLFLILNYLNLLCGNLVFNAKCFSKNLNGRCVDIDTCRPHAKAYKDFFNRLEYFPICNNKLRYVCCPIPPGGLVLTTRKPLKILTTPSLDPKKRISAISKKYCRSVSLFDDHRKLSNDLTNFF